MGLKQIRRAIRERRYEFTIHALEEMDEDYLDESDVRFSILNGEVISELTDDPRGIRRDAAFVGADPIRARAIPAGNPFEYCRITIVLGRIASAFFTIGGRL